jgi:hypothetical protein
MMSDPTRGEATTPPATSPSPDRGMAAALPADLVRTVGIFAVTVVIGVIAILMQVGFSRRAAPAVMWMLACLTCGAAVGFLFGVPKIVQDDGSVIGTAGGGTGASGYRPQVNTNLTEISDWLTKIIVGLGLINLKEIPALLAGAAAELAGGLAAGAPPPTAFAYGLITCFSTLGFLFGYVSTRLFLAGAFSRADLGTLEAVRRVEELVGTTVAHVESLDQNQQLLRASVYEGMEVDDGADGEPESPVPGTSVPPDIAPPAPDAERTTGADDAARARPGPRRGQRRIGMSGTERIAAAPADPLLALERMASDYLAITVGDYAERVRRKDAAAVRMADFALRQRIHVDDLVTLAERTRNEGVVLALAMIVNITPGRDDDARLLRVARPVTRLHVRYRVVLAFATLARKGFLSPARASDVLALLADYEREADPSLARLLSETRPAVQALVTVPSRPG